MLLSPSGAPDAYYAEFGWVAGSGTTAALPGPDTVWKQDGSGALGVDHPVTLTYDNGAGLIFRRTIAVDDHYLFTIKDEVENKGANAVTLFPYALIAPRHPEGADDYILHEGLIGYFGDHEETAKYKDIESKKSESWDATDAWLGFTDKYWAAVLLPDTDASVHARFSASDSGGLKTYQTDYLLQPQTIAPGASGSADARLFAGAKEVSVVGINFPFGPGGYNQTLQLNHFDLLIDGPVLLHHQADVSRARLLLPPRRQFRHRHPHRHGAGQAAVLPARQQVLCLDGEDEGDAAADGRDQGALRRRQDEAAAGDDGALQEGEDQSGGRLPADGDGDSGVSSRSTRCCSSPSRWLAGAVLRLDPRPLGAGPDQHFHPVRAILFIPQCSRCLAGFLHLGAWPAIMGVTMWVQMKLNLTPPDPTQQMIFNWMPIIFTFMLAHFPAGLVIYWAWNNSLSVTQQSVIMHGTA